MHTYRLVLNSIDHSMIRIAFLLYLAVQAISLPIGLDHPKNEVASDSVDVRVYYESLCPSSEEFLLQLASQAPSLAPIVSLSIFPYGNAHPSQSASNCTSCSSCNIWECNVTCQHGTQECKLNLAQACLLNFLPAITALPAIKCMEHLKIAPGWCISHHAPDGAKVAAEVAKCMRSPLGRTVQDYMATETLQRLSPPKQFVPWVTVDGVPLLEDYGRLVAFVCKAYKERGASILPSICAQPAIGNVNRGGAPAVCKRDEILGNQTVIYSRCRILPILGTVCVSVVEDSSSGAALSLGVVLDFKRPGPRLSLYRRCSLADVSRERAGGVLGQGCASSCRWCRASPACRIGTCSS